LEKHILSKSSYIKGVQCQKQLYLSKHHSKLRDAMPPERLAIFQRGSSVGILAQQLFPDGTNVGPKHPSQYRKALEVTQNAMNAGTTVLYEAAFQAHKTLILLDILVKNGDQWDAYEVKSSKSLSDTYYQDAALQYYVLINAGIKIRSFSLIHVNTDYSLQHTLNLSELFIITDVTSHVESKMEEVKNQIENSIFHLAQDQIPEQSVGKHCFSPYDCDFTGYCWSSVQKPNVFDLPLVQLETKEAWFQQNFDLKKLIQEPGIDETIRHHAHAITHRKPFLSRNVIDTNFLDHLQNSKLLFLKLLILHPAIPILQGSKPYQEHWVGLAIQSVEGNEPIEIIISNIENHNEIKEKVHQLASENTLITYAQSLGEIPHFDLQSCILKGSYYHPRMGSEVNESALAKAIGFKPEWNGINHPKVAAQKTEQWLQMSPETEDYLNLKSKLESYLTREVQLISTFYKTLLES